MWIREYKLIFDSEEIEITLEIDNIYWDNDSIGWYEYGGKKVYDTQPDYVSDFDISEIYIYDEKVISKKLFNELSELLKDDDKLKKEIENIDKGGNW